MRPEDIQKLEERGLTVTLFDDTPCDASEIIKRAGDAEIVISVLCEITQEIIDANPSLKMLALATTGCDGVDLQAAHARDITVTYTPGYATQAVAEHTIALMLAAGRLAFGAANDFRGGLYDHCRYQGKELYGNKLGVIGYGRIGRRVAEIATKGFGMQVRYSDQETSPDELRDIMCTSDFITLHVPLTQETRHMISEKEFIALCFDENGNARRNVILKLIPNAKKFNYKELEKLYERIQEFIRKA